MRRLLGTVAILLLISLPLAPTVGAQGGEDPFSGPAEYTVHVYLGETPQGETQMDIYPPTLTIQPDTRVTFNVVNVGDVNHDFTFTDAAILEQTEHAEEDVRARQDDGSDAVKTPDLAPGDAYNLTVTFPAEMAGGFDYICSVPGHADLGMQGTLNVGAAAGGGEEEITELGVNYYAYWVGIISFIIIFAVLFGVFFFFRYGESKNVVDHRTGAKTVTAAASGAETGAPVEDQEGFLPDPSMIAILLSLIAIGLWALTEFTSLFGGA